MPDLTPEQIAKALARAKLIISYKYSENSDATIVARALLAAGYRKVTVTPEQIETAAKAIRDAYYEDCGIPPGSEFPTEPAEWLGEAHAAARAFGLSAALQFGLVPEEGAQ